MAAKNQVTMTFAGDGKQLQDTFDKVGESAKKMDENVKDASDGMKGSFDKAGEGLDTTYNKFDGLESIGRGTSDTMSGLGDIMRGNVLQGSTDLAGGVAALAVGFNDALLPAIKGAVTGFKGAALAVKSFTISLLTNPVFLIGAAIALLVVGLVVLYKKSETARNIMNEAFAGIGRALLFMAKVALSTFGSFADAALFAAEKVIGAMAKIPGPQQASLKKAAESIRGFRDDTKRFFDSAIGKVEDWDQKLREMPKVAKLKGDIKDLSDKLETAKQKLKDPKLTAEKKAKVKADIADLEAKLRTAKTKLANLPSQKTVTVTYNEIITRKAPGEFQGGSYGARAAGGPVMAGMPYLVGENGPEIIVPSSSGTVIPNGGGGRGGVGRMVLELRSSGQRTDDLLVQILRNAIKVKGGNVQVVLGT